MTRTQVTNSAAERVHSRASFPARHPLRDRRDDLYETPPCAVEALLKVEPLPVNIWEPACGPGSIVRVLRQHGHKVVASDLRDHHCPYATSGVDFLIEFRAPDGIETILTNPPFKLVEPFVEHALDLCPTVIMLCRLG